MRHPYPVVLDLMGRVAVVVGGGTVAVRKVTSLLEAGAVVTVVAPVLSPRIDISAVNWLSKRYEPGDLPDAAALVIACTDDKEVNRRVCADARSIGALTNDASDPDDADFHNMAVVKGQDVVIAVSTRGKNPGLAKTIKNRIRRWLEESELL